MTANSESILRQVIKATGTVGGLLLGFVGVVWCGVTQPNCLTTDVSKDDQHRLSERHELDQRRVHLKGALCNDTVNAAMAPALHRTDGKIAYVRPEQFEPLDVDQRELFAAWVGLCIANEDDSIIADGQTGETLAFWYLKHGYRPQ